MKLSPLTKSFAVLALGASIVTSVATLAQAQNYAYMSCGELWYERNAIYARNGYCFKTRRARNVFGRACFAPWGRLAGWEQREVDDIVRWERRKGCR